MSKLSFYKNILNVFARTILKTTNMTKRPGKYRIFGKTNSIFSENEHIDKEKKDVKFDYSIIHWKKRRYPNKSPFIENAEYFGLRRRFKLFQTKT